MSQVTKAIRLKVHEKYNGRCAYCGCNLPYNKMQVDHIRPQRNFYLGSKADIPHYDVHDIQNLNPSCARCNKRKDTFSIEQFRIEIAAQLERLPKYNANYRLAMDYGLITESQKPVKFYFETLQP
jgi:uncharacterized protein (TIGR02646 family)